MIELIGAGLPRTGTLTQKEALELLGLGPCYHWIDVLADLDVQVPLWGARSTGAFDPAEILAGYRSTVDWPGGYFYRELLDSNPDAKVLLSVRDPERWERSFRETIVEMCHGESLIRLLSSARAHIDPKWRRYLQFVDRMFWSEQGTFAAGQSPDALIEAFVAHNEEVKRHRAGRATARMGGLRRLGAAMRVSRCPRACGAAAARQRPRDVPGSGDRRCDHDAQRVGRAAEGATREVMPIERDGMAADAENQRPGGNRSGGTMSQRDVLALLELEGDEFAERVFTGAAVTSRSLGLFPATLERTLQGRTQQTEDQLFESGVSTWSSGSASTRREIGTVVTASLYSLGGPTLAHRLVEHFRMHPATDKYHVVGVGCASAVPLVRLVVSSLENHPGKKGLIVAAESMSGLMTRGTPGDQRAKTVGSAIFGDGCAAAVIEKGSTGPAVAASKVHQIGGTLDVVRMELSDDDSYLHMDRDLPDVAAAACRSSSTRSWNRSGSRAATSTTGSFTRVVGGSSTVSAPHWHSAAPSCRSATTCSRLEAMSARPRSSTCFQRRPSADAPGPESAV